MELHNLKPSKGATKKRKRIARGEGSGHGGTATKGHKGMKARSGASTTKSFEGGQTPLQRRLPKVGFKNINRIEYVYLNVDQLGAIAEKNNISQFDQDVYSKLGICSKNERIKILGRGEINKALQIKADACTESAMNKVKAAGGSIEVNSAK